LNSRIFSQLDGNPTGWCLFRKATQPFNRLAQPTE